MITINTLIKDKAPVNKPLTAKQRAQLIKENKNANYSYLCLLREMLNYKYITPKDILNGWGGVKLVQL